MNKRKRLENYYQRKTREFDKRQKWNRMRKYLEGFKPKYLQQIIKYHQLNCVDINQIASYLATVKCFTLREAKLNYQQIWSAVINNEQ